MDQTRDEAIRVLLVAGDERDRATLASLMARAFPADGWEMDWAPDLAQASGREEDGGHDAALIVDRTGGPSALATLRSVREGVPGLPAILVAEGDGPGFAREALRLGASDVLDASDLDPEALGRSLRYAIGRARDAEALVRASREAQAAREARDRMIAMLSHELRTPLTPVLLAVTALLEAERSTEAEIRATLEMVRQNIELEARLIDDLLDLARASAGGLRLDRAPLDAHEAIRRSVEARSPEIARGGLFVDLDFRAADSLVLGDGARVEQIAGNLIANAAKFAAPGDRLTIVSRHEPGEAGELRLVVEFRDNGQGMTPETLAKVFEPFEQGRPACGGLRPSGLGLGLAISRALAEAQGGGLSAESAGPGRGTTFRLDLGPVLARPRLAAMPPPIAVPVPSARASDSPLKGLRILLVEDNRDSLRYFQIVLGRDHHVLAASGASEAYELAFGQEFDLLLSDIELPDGSGIDLMSRLATPRGVPGIAMSGYGSREDIEASLAAGFSQHLVKPIPREALLAAIVGAVGHTRGVAV